MNNLAFPTRSLGNGYTVSIDSSAKIGPPDGIRASIGTTATSGVCFSFIYINKTVTN
jgi:hypothetical protein